MNITYKKLELKDILLLTPIMKASFDEDTKLHTQLSEDGPKGYDNGELLKRMLCIENSISMVILCNDEIIGEYTVSRDNKYYTLELLFISPQHASKGIGSIVWSDIERKYGDAETWIVETPAYSIRNHHFYEKCGFRILKEISYTKEDKSLIFIKHINTMPLERNIAEH